MSEDKRPSWVEHFIAGAEWASGRGECRRRKVGALIFDSSNMVLGTGHNGTIPKMLSCLDGNCPRGLLTYEQVSAGSNYSNCIAIHAEPNAIRAAINNVGPARVRGASMAISSAPCDGCQTIARAAGITTLYWPNGTLELT